jgi:acetyltransferase-like isoleucine patch superfamily enzyme
MKFIIKIKNQYLKKNPNHAFLHYSWFSTVTSAFLDISPPFLRNFFFKKNLGKFGDNSLIDYKTYIRYFKNLEIGDNVAINRGCQFYTSYHLSKKIYLGNNVTISPNVKFYGAAQDYHYLPMPDTADNIVIEDDCWICANSIILQGVTIGKGSVIGAGSVVTKNIPPYSIAVGSPARVIKNREIL